MAATLIYQDRPTSVSSAAAGGEELWLTLGDLRAATGWELKPEGACLNEICVPLPVSGRDRFLRGEGEGAEFNLTALAERIGQPVIHDPEHDLWYFGTRWALGAEPFALEAPNFTLPDASGQMHSLAEQRGKKVLLVTWASW